MIVVIRTAYPDVFPPEFVLLCLLLRAGPIILIKKERTFLLKPSHLLRCF